MLPVSASNRWVCAWSGVRRIASPGRKSWRSRKIALISVSQKREYTSVLAPVGSTTATLQASAPHLAGTVGGGEMMKDLVGGALARLSGDERLHVAAAVSQSFSHIFFISAALSCCSFLFAGRLPDTVRAGRGGR